MQEDTQAGMIYAYLEDYTGDRVCSCLLYTSPYFRQCDCPGQRTVENERRTAYHLPPPQHRLYLPEPVSYTHLNESPEFLCPLNQEVTIYKDGLPYKTVSEIARAVVDFSLVESCLLYTSHISMGM